jgi:raffinose/stachyose/melibiose transport system permease protein
MATVTDTLPADRTALPPETDTAKQRVGPRLTHYLLLLPPVALFSVFIVLPAIQGAFYSFTNFVGFGSWKFIGLTNYIAALRDPNIRHSYIFTLYFAFTTTIVVNLLALFIAIGLNSRIRWRGGFRTIYFIPMVVSGLVVSYVFSYLFNTSIPGIIGFGPLHSGILLSSNWAWLGVVFVTTWQSLPGATIIFLAGLAAIDNDVYEAAELDGADGRRSLRYMTMPLLAPFVIINTVLSLKGFLGAYDIIIGLTNGGPGTATQSISLTIINGLGTGDYAYQLANSMMFFILTIVLSVAQLAFLSRANRRGA